jgi:hypothetical protein
MPAARIVPQRNYFGLLCGQVARSESMCSLTRRWHTVSIGADYSHTPNPRRVALGSRAGVRQRNTCG